MHKIKRLLRATSLIAVLLLAGTMTGLASQHKQDASQKGEKETSADEVKTEAAETYEALKQYTLEQRDEAMATARERLAELDARIDKMQTRLDKRWQEMSEATREQTRDTLEGLRQQREEVAEWYGGMRHSSAEAWEEVKKGFSDSYDRLKKAFRDARKDFENDQEEI